MDPEEEQIVNVTWDNLFLRNRPELAQYPGSLQCAAGLLHRFVGPIIKAPQGYDIPLIDKGLDLVPDSIMGLVAAPFVSHLSQVRIADYRQMVKETPIPVGGSAFVVAARAVGMLLQVGDLEGAMLLMVSLALPALGEDIIGRPVDPERPFNLGVAMFLEPGKPPLITTLPLPAFACQLQVGREKADATKH